MIEAWEDDRAAYFNVEIGIRIHLWCWGGSPHAAQAVNDANRKSCLLPPLLPRLAPQKRRCLPEKWRVFLKLKGFSENIVVKVWSNPHMNTCEAKESLATSGLGEAERLRQEIATLQSEARGRSWGRDTYIMSVWAFPESHSLTDDGFGVWVM